MRPHDASRPAGTTCTRYRGLSHDTAHRSPPVQMTVDFEPPMHAALRWLETAAALYSSSGRSLSAAIRVVLQSEWRLSAYRAISGGQRYLPSGARAFASWLQSCAGKSIVAQSAK